MLYPISLRIRKSKISIVLTQQAVIFIYPPPPLQMHIAFKWLHCTHSKEQDLLFATMLAPFLFHYGVDDFPGRYPLVGNPFVATDHPNEHIGQGVLWLK